MAITLGAIRIRPKGGDGDHNELIDIITFLKTQDFACLRFGMGNNYAKGFQVDYVLDKWSAEEEKILMSRIKITVDAAKHFGLHVLENTMTMYDKK